MIPESSMFGAPVSHRAVVPALIALLTAAVAVPGTVGAQEAAPETETYWLSLDHIQGNWVRVESNNPSNDGMRIRVERDRATITSMPPRGSSRFHVGQVVWQDLSTFDSGSGSLEVRGSDGAYYPSEMTITEITGVRGQATRLAIDVDKENSPGNDQTWAYAGPSIDGDWVLVDGGNQGLRVRVDGDRATIRFVPATAGREFRVGDLLWRNIGSGDRGDLPGYQGRLEALSGGRSYRPAIYDTYRDNRIIISLDSESGQYWYRPEDAEKQMATVDEEDEDEGALLGLPHEPVDDPLAQDPDLEPSDGARTVDIPEDPTPPVREPGPEEEAACLATSLRHDRMDLAWSWGLSISPSTELEMDAALSRYSGVSRQDGLVVDLERSRVPDLDDHHSYIWQANVGQLLWKDHRDLTPSELDTHIESYRDQGFRLIDIEGYSTPAGTRYAGVWVENREGVDWLSDFDLTSTEYGTLYQERRESGYRLVDLEAYPMSSGVHFAGIWYRSCDNSNWRQNRNLTEAQFETRAADLGSRGFNIVDFESYETAQGQRYGAIWEQVPSRAWTVARDQSLKWFLNHHRRYLDEGFRLIDYESYETAEGTRYAGVWAENDSRYSWAAKTTIENSIRDYRAQNELPGISVVIIQNGDVVYRRGFGWADSVAQKRAHSETVYLTASISKVIGATLAARMEERGVGDLDLSRNTGDYLPAAEYHQDRPYYMDNCFRRGGELLPNWECQDIPTIHTHTLEQLLSKTGCVSHYREGREPDQSRFYRWRVEALAQIHRDSSLLDNCTPGMHYRYSTHGFTYLGAALEAVAQKDIAQLLQDEIARPFDLASMRAMYTDDGSDGYPVNYDRAQAYSLTNTNRNRPPPGPNNPTVRAEYSPNASWKVLGGGIEAHALDLARFGWKLLDGEIVSEAVRDDRLWTSLTDSAASWVDQSTNPPSTPSTLPGGGVGMAWNLGGSMSSTNGRSVRHGGTAVGAGSYLKIWRDRDLVIAMLSNRSLHDNLSRNGLLDRLANIVLASTPP